MIVYYEMAESDQEDEDAYPDWLMLAPSQEYERGEIAIDSRKSCVDDDVQRFGPVVGEDELCTAVSESVPKKTREHTKWCVDTWSEWRLHRISIAKADSEKPPNLEEMTNEQLNYWLSCFVMEVRRKDGSEYVGTTIHGLVCGLQRHLRAKRPGIVVDVLSGPEFHRLREVMNAKMKSLKKCGIGVKRKQAETISYEEELLWNKGYLGNSSPQILLDTMVWMNGLYFALRSGSEHRCLTFNQLECRDNVLIYTEAQSKNHPGGLAEHHDKPKVVYHYADENNPSRCFIRLFKQYRSLCPSGVLPFYLTPLQRPCADCWYSKTPVGRNTLGSTVARLCKLANIQGLKSNHLLHATAATLSQQYR